MKHYTKLMGAVLLALVATSGVSAQSDTPELRQQISEVFDRVARRLTNVGQVKIDSIVTEKKTITVWAGANAPYIPYREDNVREIYDGVKALLPAEWQKLKLSVRADGEPIENYIPIGLRSGKTKEKTFKTKDVTPLTTCTDAPTTPTHGLQNRHIAMWQSHGRYYEQKLDRWEWQRARIFQTVEDLYTQSYVLPFLVPMLERAGANVLLPRERDANPVEVIVDGESPNTSTFAFANAATTWKKGTGTGFAHKRKVYVDHQNPFTEGEYYESGTVRREADQCLAIWTPDLPETREYAVYVSYKSFANSTTDACYSVHHLGGETEFHVNQRMAGGTWVYLGTFPFEKGDSGFVRMTSGDHAGGILSADAVRFGGGMGKVERGGDISGFPAFAEGALYSLQWAGIDMHLFDEWENDYTRDYASRGRWVSHMSGGSRANPDAQGRKVPFDLSFAFHSDAGVTPNDSIVGTLGIYTLLSDNSDLLPNGESRMNGRLLTDIVQTQVVDDIRKQFEPKWTRRKTWDRSYNESRTPSVPAMLLELLSHQNFADMKYGLDPTFRFTVSRAVYKGILKYLSARYGCAYAVQPLPVKAFSAEVRGTKAVLSWEAAVDKDEPTAKPTGYILYTREGDGAFNEGVRLEDVTVEGNRITTTVPLHRNRLYSFRIVAYNEGGKSFPSETLTAATPGDDAKKVLIVNNFTRISAPAWFDTPSYGGFMDNMDSGVPYIREINFVGEVNEFDRTKPWTDDDNPGFGGSFTNRAGRIIAGNTFDFPSVHGRALLDAGYAVSSTSVDAFSALDASAYPAVDIICGKQVTTKIGRGAVPDRYTVFPPTLQEALRKYASAGGSILISGSYIGTDAWDQVYPGPVNTPLREKTRTFIQEVLGYKWITNFGDISGIVVPKAGAPIRFSDPMNYNRLFSDRIYRVENPDGIGPASDKAQTILRYAGTQIPAATVFDDGTHRAVAFGFPIETLTTEGALESVLRISMKYLIPQAE